MAEAADALGLTVDAVRSRVKRGTIDHVRVGSRVYVLLGADEAHPGHDQEARESEDRTAELIVTLREQLQTERQARAEARRLLAAALERIPAIEAPLEVSETADEPQGRGGERQDAHRAAVPRSPPAEGAKPLA